MPYGLFHVTILFFRPIFQKFQQNRGLVILCAIMSEVNTSSSRFYENKFPEVDDLVVVNVKEIADMGAYGKCCPVLCRQSCHT